MAVDLNKIKKAHFIGIGGIGISAAAGLLQSRGVEVSGSDAVYGEVTSDLQARGIAVFAPQNAAAITADIDLIVYSVAVPEDNPERIRAKELNIPELTYPQLLGILMQDKFAIGISGTDGKTTTTAMLAKIILDARLDPTVVLGSRADFLTNNWHFGRGEYFVFESDEYRRAFDNYSPRAAIITNIGVDHLDYYIDKNEYIDAFKNYLKRVREDGFIVINNDDERSIEAALKTKAKIITYAIDHPADYTAEIIEVAGGRQRIMIKENGDEAAEISLSLPGKYNVSNALAAIAGARKLEIGWEKIKESLEEFKGTWRRFERLGKCGPAEVIADYAHTPPAIRGVIAAAKEFYPNEKILFVFQPHQLARTKNLFGEFVLALSLAEKVVLADIFFVRGREKPEDFDVSSKKLAEAVGDSAVYGGDLKESEELVRELSKNFDRIIVMGAGDVYDLAKNLVK